jgi:hypothetical protein
MLSLVLLLFIIYYHFYNYYRDCCSIEFLSLTVPATVKEEVVVQAVIEIDQHSKVLPLNPCWRAGQRLR